MVGGRCYVRELRDQPADQVKYHKTRAPDHVLNTGTKQEQINHVACQVKKSCMYKQGCYVGPPMRKGRGQPKVGHLPFHTLGAIGEPEGEADEVKANTYPHQGEGNHGITSGPIIDAYWQQEEHSRWLLTSA